LPSVRFDSIEEIENFLYDIVIEQQDDIQIYTDELRFTRKMLSGVSELLMATPIPVPKYWGTVENMALNVASEEDYRGKDGCSWVFVYRIDGVQYAFVVARLDPGYKTEIKHPLANKDVAVGGYTMDFYLSDVTTPTYYGVVYGENNTCFSATVKFATDWEKIDFDQFEFVQLQPRKTTAATTVPTEPPTTELAK
jgi:hypothetical protein